MASFERISAKRLSAALYEVQRLCRHIPVLAIHWIQLQYPIYPIQDAFLRGKPADKGFLRIKNGLDDCRKVLACIKNVFALSLQITRLRWHFRAELATLKHTRFQFVAKSWCFGPERADDGTDFYLGDLQHRLQARGFPTLLLCGNGKPTDWIAFARAHISPSGLCRLPERCLLTPWAPFRMFLHQVLTAISLQKGAFATQDALVQKLCRLASREVLSTESLYNGTFYDIGQEVARIWNPTALITLYEGRSWERCLWQGVKDVLPTCQIVGYQHSVIFSYLRALIAPEPDVEACTVPDVALCQGEATRSMMVAGHKACGTKLIAFGSFRRTEDKGEPVLPNPEKRTALVLPVGWREESRLLFDFILDLAVEVPDHRFILRCHPVLPFDDVRPFLKRRLEDVPNVVVSTHANMDDDVAQASVVFYRGTSAVLAGVLQGLKPIYYYSPDHHDEDPLFEMDSWCERVQDVHEGKVLLQQYANTEPGALVQQWQTGVDYVRRYSMPVTAESMTHLLTTLGCSDNQEMVVHSKTV